MILHDAVLQAKITEVIEYQAYLGCIKAYILCFILSTFIFNLY